MPVPTATTAAILIIGNEILSGRTRDANLPYLARALNDCGVRLREARVVADDQGAIVAALNALRRDHDYVFTTGGIGPTHDDITAAAVAAAFDTRLIRHPEAEALLRAHYPADQLNPARLKMADIPEGASLVPNPVSKAPGFRIDNVFVLAGVPRIMQAQFDAIKSMLHGGVPMDSATISAFMAEGDLAEPLAALQAAHARTEIGSYPFLHHGRLGVSVVIRAAERADIAAAAGALRAHLDSLGIEIAQTDI